MKAFVIYGSKWGGTANIDEKVGQVLTREKARMVMSSMPRKSLKT